MAGLADQICVMYAGKIVESGEVNAVLDNPMHPYTHGLITSVPSKNKRGAPLSQIPGMAPSLLNLPKGCAFAPRCKWSNSNCQEQPDMRLAPENRRLLCHNPIEYNNDNFSQETS